MKTLGFIVSSCLVLGLSATASAELYTTQSDPSGARMCFDTQGDKAPIAECETFAKKSDPTGVNMCFTSKGDKAPLAECGVDLTAAVMPAQEARPGAFLATLSFFL